MVWHVRVYGGRGVDVYSAGQKNAVKGCVSRGFNPATFYHVFCPAVYSLFPHAKPTAGERGRASFAAIYEMEGNTFSISTGAFSVSLSSHCEEHFDILSPFAIQKEL